IVRVATRLASGRSAAVSDMVLSSIAEAPRLPENPARDAAMWLTSIRRTTFPPRLHMGADTGADTAGLDIRGRWHRSADWLSFTAGPCGAAWSVMPAAATSDPSGGALGLNRHGSASRTPDGAGLSQTNPLRHGRACPGHPPPVGWERRGRCTTASARVAGPRPAMTDRERILLP